MREMWNQEVLPVEVDVDLDGGGTLRLKLPPSEPLKSVLQRASKARWARRA